MLNNLSDFNHCSLFFFILKYWVEHIYEVYNSYGSRILLKCWNISWQMSLVLLRTTLEYFSLDVCVYKGVSHKQGETWYDGCEFECMCENAKYGYYRCNKR